MRGRAQKKLIRDVSMEACHCSKWLYWLCGRKEWERRDVSSDNNSLGRSDSSSTESTIYNSPVMGAADATCQLDNEYNDNSVYLMGGKKVIKFFNLIIDNIWLNPMDHVLVEQ